MQKTKVNVVYVNILTQSFVLLLIRQGESHIATIREAKKESMQLCTTYKGLFLFRKHLLAALHRHVYHHNAYCLFTVWRGVQERQNAAVGLFCSLKAEGGHGNIY